jgi:large subunit ribosomal protein L18
MTIHKREQRIKRQTRTRAKIKHAGLPRVSVARSNKHLFVQIIDDVSGKTLVSVHDGVKKNIIKGTKTERAIALGEMLAKKAKEAGITKVVFDRGGYQYHGRVKALADSLRKGDIHF